VEAVVEVVVDLVGHHSNQARCKRRRRRPGGGGAEDQSPRATKVLPPRRSRATYSMVDGLAVEGCGFFDRGL